MLTLNLCVVLFLGLIPVLIIPLRYFIVIGLWGAIAQNSPFCVAVGKSIIQISMEYGIVLERTLPTYMSDLHESIENDYIPRTLAVLRWVPIVRRYVPAQTKSDK